MKPMQKKQPPIQQKPKTSFVKRIAKGISRYYRNIVYIIIVLILWGYLIYNWEKCISMQLFSQFDGNNILFLVGIALIILPFFRFEIEGKGIKVQAEMRKEMQADFQNADSDYKIKLIQKLISSDSEDRKEDN